MQRVFRVLLIFTIAGGAGGCNLFSIFGSPSGDDQYLSAARACLDQGDLTCALENYGKVSSENTDVATAETAFATLDRAGASAGSFTKAVSGENLANPGKAITALAGAVGRSATPGASLRKNIFSAYQYLKTIQAPDLRGEVRFVTALWLIAAALAEDSGVPGQLKAADLAVDPAQCAQQPVSACFSSVACSGPIGKKLVSGPDISSLDTATDTQLDGAPSFHMIRAALDQVSTGVAEMGAAKAFGAFVDQLKANQAATPLPVDSGSVLDSPCFRWALIAGGVGE